MLDELDLKTMAELRKIQNPILQDYLNQFARKTIKATLESIYTKKMRYFFNKVCKRAGKIHEERQIELQTRAAIRI